MTTQAQTEKRKIPKIVFDRQPLKKLRFLLITLAGLALGVLVAWLFYWLGNGENTEFPPVFEDPELYGWFYALGLLGLVCGIVFGWSWERAVTARIEMVEAPPLGRRRTATSTAMVRVDVSGRSRY